MKANGVSFYEIKNKLPRFFARAEKRVLGFLFGKEPGFVLGMTMGGEIPNTAVNKISQARGLVEEGKAGDALAYLGIVALNYIQDGETTNARICLREAVRIFKGERDPNLFRQGLRIAELNLKLDEKIEAEAIFTEVLSFVSLIPDLFQRDEVRTAIVYTYRAGGEMQKALKVAGRIEGGMCRFDVFMRMAKWLVLEGQSYKAKELLLGECLIMAGKRPDRFHFPERHIMIAKILIGMNDLPEAQGVLRRAYDFILRKGWANVDAFGRKKLEEIGLCLISMGERDLAVKLLTAGWIIEEGLSSEEIKMLQDNVIEQRWPNIDRALKGSS